MCNLVLNASWLGDWFYGIWINLMLLIDNVIYVFINWMYRIFMLVAKVDIFGGGAEIEAITRRVYVIVGIAMLFIFAYNLILLIINPEGKQLGNMAKVVQRAIISIILVTLLPLIFSYLTTIQNHVLESNVIGQIILGTSSNTDIQTTNKKAGVKAALDIFSAFYHPKGQTYNTCKSDDSAHELCPEYVAAFESAYQNDDISTFIWDDDLKDGTKEDKMEYNWIISTAAGVFALWMFVSFALDIGVRVGKIAFYELISPIPVMMRILPNDKMYDKWFKGITSTFISLFVRLAVIYFCMYAITLVPEVLSNMWATNGDNIVLLALANVVVILGILKFAQEAPKLISDLFGGSGDLKFGIAKKVTDNKLAMGGLGMMRGGFGSASRNMFKSWRESGAAGDTLVKRLGKTTLSTIGGLFGGGKRGASAGYGSSSFKDFRNKSDSAIEATTEKRKERASYKALHGGTIRGAIGGHIRDAVVAQGIWTGADADRDIIDRVQYEDKVIKSYDGYKEIYNGAKYQEMASKLNKLEADLAAGDASAAGKISSLKNAMKNERIASINKNQGAAAYAVYEISQAINSDPGMFEQLGRLGMQQDQIDMLKSLRIDGNEVLFKDATGTERTLNGSDLSDILENTTITDPVTGAVTHVDLNAALGKVRGHYSNDKGSVVYKNQKRIEQERKEKKDK